MMRMTNTHARRNKTPAIAMTQSRPVDILGTEIVEGVDISKETGDMMMTIKRP